MGININYLIHYMHEIKIVYLKNYFIHYQKNYHLPLIHNLFHVIYFFAFINKNYKNYFFLLFF